MTTTQIAFSEPLYGASFPQAVLRFFRKYATFSGRASRREYWWWVLANVLVSLAFNLIGSLTTGTLIPALALTWRRLHDTDRSGVWFFIVFIPIVGAIVLLVFTLLSARPAGARFDE